MSDLATYSNQFDRNVSNVMNNPYVSGFLTLFGILYISMARPALPVFMQELFEYVWFRFFVLVLTAYIATKNLKVALIVAIAFVVTLNLLNEQKIAEGFRNGIRSRLEKFQDKEVDDDKEIESLSSDSNQSNEKVE